MPSSTSARPTSPVSDRGHAGSTPIGHEQRRRGTPEGVAPVRARLSATLSASKSSSEDTMGPLSGMKVLDLTHVMAGPTCTLMLADMGADVIKVEKRPDGDDTRRMIPPKIGDEAAAYMMMNRNKRGIVLDLKTEGGRKILRQLVQSADVLVENFGPGVMERLGFGYEDLKKGNPGLIYCSLSGFGRTGPYKDRRGFDLVAQAMSGIMSFTGEAGRSEERRVGKEGRSWWAPYH